MSRDRYKELLKYIRFDVRSTRSERVDKFPSFQSYGAALLRTAKHTMFMMRLFPSTRNFFQQGPDIRSLNTSPVNLTNQCIHWMDFLIWEKMTTVHLNVCCRSDVVLQLMQPFLGKGRNMTTDNFFTSLKLAEQLKSKATSIVGQWTELGRKFPMR